MNNNFKYEKFDDDLGDLSQSKIINFEDLQRGFAGNKDPMEHQQRLRKKQFL